VAALEFDETADPETLTEPAAPEGEYELLSEEDLNTLFNENTEELPNEKQTKSQQNTHNRRHS